MDILSATTRKCWITILLAISIETYAATLLKQSRDQSNLKLFAVACALYFICLLGFTASLSKVDIGIAYAVWAAMGTTIVSIVGIFYFHESCSPLKILCLLFVITGIVGLNH